MLKDKNDEFNFEQLARAAIFKVNIDGTASLWKETYMFSGISFSPDGNYVMITTIEKPFSYLVPYYRFPSTTIIYNNIGTYPMQSERYFNALKGLGATVRLVMLPNESHGYVARESILHMLWEQDQWLDKYVKNRE